MLDIYFIYFPIICSIETLYSHNKPFIANKFHRERRLLMFTVIRDSRQISVLCFVIHRSSHPDVFLGKGVLKICSKFTGEHGCSPVNLLYIFRTPFPKNTSGRLHLNILRYISLNFDSKLLLISNLF